MKGKGSAAGALLNAALDAMPTEQDYWLLKPADLDAMQAKADRIGAVLREQAEQQAEEDR